MQSKLDRGWDVAGFARHKKKGHVATLVSQQLGAALGGMEVTACAMERREGAEYDFNEPMLEAALQTGAGDAIVALMFLGPGRHAGPGGDIADIVRTSAGGARVFYPHAHFRELSPSTPGRTDVARDSSKHIKKASLDDVLAGARRRARRPSWPGVRRCAARLSAAEHRARR